MKTAGCVYQVCFFAEYMGRCSQNITANPVVTEDREHFVLTRPKTIPNDKKKKSRSVYAALVGLSVRSVESSEEV